MSRLEEIKHITAYLERATNDEDGPGFMYELERLHDNGHIDWLINQLEYEKQALINQEKSADREIYRLKKRVGELEKENKGYEHSNGYLVNRNLALKEESERLKQSRNDYRRKWRKVRRNQNECGASF